MKSEAELRQIEAVLVAEKYLGDAVPSDGETPLWFWMDDWRCRCCFRLMTNRCPLCRSHVPDETLLEVLRNEKRS